MKERGDLGMKPLDDGARRFESVVAVDDGCKKSRLIVGPENGILVGVDVGVALREAAP